MSFVIGLGLGLMICAGVVWTAPDEIKDGVATVMFWCGLMALLTAFIFFAAYAPPVGSVLVEATVTPTVQVGK